MQVQDIELLVTQRPNRAQRAGEVGRNRGDRPVREGRNARAQRCDTGLGRCAVARSEHSCLVAARSQRSSQTQHLHLDTARAGQAVGRDDPDSHGQNLIDRTSQTIRALVLIAAQTLGAVCGSHNALS